MTDPREIGPLRGPQFQVPTNQPQVPRPVQRERRERDHGENADRIDIHPARQIVLELIRERVLSRTREELRVEASHSPVRFAIESVPTVETYVSRLLGEQNMIVGRRRGEWPEAELDAAVERATKHGMSEAIEILEELGRLDGAALEMVSAILEEMQRKVSNSLP